MGKSRRAGKRDRKESRRDSEVAKRSLPIAHLVVVIGCFLSGAGLMALREDIDFASGWLSTALPKVANALSETPVAPSGESASFLQEYARATDPGLDGWQQANLSGKKPAEVVDALHRPSEVGNAQIASADASGLASEPGQFQLASFQDDPAPADPGSSPPVLAPPVLAPPVPTASFSGDVLPRNGNSQPVSYLRGADLPAAIPPASSSVVGNSNGLQNDRQISFSFGGAPWGTVLQKLAEEAGYALEIKGMPPGSFSYSDSSRHSVAEAIDIVNGFLIREGFVLIRHGRLMMVVEVDEIPIHLIEQLSEAELPQRGRFELVSVEIAVNEVSVQDMATELQPLLTKLGKIVPIASANRLVVSDLREKLQQVLSLIHAGDLETAGIRSEVITLKNTNAEDVVKSLQQMMGNSVAVAAGSSAGSNRSASGSPVVSVLETNCIIIRGRENALAKIRELVADLDRLPAQVHIQAMLVEVELSDTDEFGVELGIQDSLLFRRSIIDDVLTLTESVSDPATGIVTTTQRVINQTTSPGFNFNNSPLGNNTSQAPGRLAGQALSSLSVGRMNSDEGYGGLVLAAGNESLSILLRALKANREVNILSRPTIRTVHNRQASIQMGAQVPVVDGVTMSPTGAANPVVRQDKSGIILEVTPKIAETGVIFLDVKAEKSEFRTGPGSGTPIFTESSSGNVIEAPIKDVTEAIATVNITSGQTVVLGGMITAGEVQSTRKVPIIGDWPLVGPLFRYEYVANRRKELLIFLTPEIIYSDDDARRIAQRELENSKIDMNFLMPVPACPPGTMPQDGNMFDEAQPPAPGFKPAEDWYVPRFQKWGDSTPGEMPPVDRSSQVGTFLENSAIGGGHSFLTLPEVTTFPEGAPIP